MFAAMIYNSIVALCALGGAALLFLNGEWGFAILMLIAGLAFGVSYRETHDTSAKQ